MSASVRRRLNPAFPVAVLGLLCLAASCRNSQRAASLEDRLSAYLADEHAKPLLLHDHEELLAYLKAFPRGDYDLYPTANGFSFFIEKRTAIDGIKKVIARGEVWEDYFFGLMAKYIRPGSAVIDAGAYIGTHSLSMARFAGPQGRVFAFEPQKKVFRELVFNLVENKASNVTPLRFALGEAVRVVEMGKPVEGIEANVGIGQGGDQAELRTLDSFGLQDVSFIKIDVEGYEDGVLDGARRTLAENGRPPILIEIMSAADFFTARPEVKARIETTLGKLEALGYVVTPVRPRDYLALPRRDYPLGSVISFADSGNSDSYRSGWWSSAEPWGTWTAGHSADLVLSLAQVPRKDLMLMAKVKGHVNEKNPRQDVEVFANGRQIDRWVFRTKDELRVKVIVPLSSFQDIEGRPVLRITFRIIDPKSPAELGFSTDDRRIGLGVYEVAVRE